jgi:hypothetical protein
MLSTRRCLLASVILFAAPMPIIRAAVLNPGGNAAVSRLDPNDPSLTGATHAALNSDFITY